MTKKDYELIAYCLFTANITEAIESKKEHRERNTRARFAEWFADNLEKRNPKFDRNKFFRACGVKQYECFVFPHGVESYI